MPTTKCPDRVQPKRMKTDLGKLPEMAEGETEETGKENISACIEKRNEKKQ